MISSYLHYTHHWIGVYQHHQLGYGLAFLVIGLACSVVGVVFRDRLVVNNDSVGRVIIPLAGVTSIVSGVLILSGLWTALFWASLILAWVLVGLFIIYAVSVLAFSFKPMAKSANKTSGPPI
jgi:hypothetical protein